MLVYFNLLWVGLSNYCVCITVLGGSASACNILGKSLVLPCVSERVKPLWPGYGPTGPSHLPRVLGVSANTHQLSVSRDL